MSDLTHLLIYENGNDSFKWLGSAEELRNFVNFALDVNPRDEDVLDLSYDKIHNAVTYKIKEKISVRLYTTTCKIVIHGPKNQELKKRFLETLGITDQSEIGLAMSDNEILDPSSGGNSFLPTSTEDESTQYFTSDKATSLHYFPSNPFEWAPWKTDFDEIREELTDLRKLVYSSLMQMSNSHKSSENNEHSLELIRENEDLKNHLQCKSLLLENAQERIKELENTAG